MIQIVDLVIFYQSTDGNRSAYYPGQDVSTASQEVLDAVAVHWTPEAVQAWREANQGEPAPPATDWDGFNSAILSDTEFNQVYAAVMASHPLIAAALPAALTQVASGQTAMFATLFAQMCAVAQVPPTQRAAWATLAEGYHAPAEFMAVLRG